MVAPKGVKKVRFDVVEAASEGKLGFDPEAFSKRGNATCPFCGTVADNEYVKTEARSNRMRNDLLSIAALRGGGRGKVYLNDRNQTATDELRRVHEICRDTGLTVPTEQIEARMTGGSCIPYGLTDFGKLFTSRQLAALLSFAHGVRVANEEMLKRGLDPEQAKALCSLLACVLDKQADFDSSLCTLKPDGGRGILHTFTRQALQMVWDFAEANPFCEEIASWPSSLREVVTNIESLSLASSARVDRGSATSSMYGCGVASRRCIQNTSRHRILRRN
jgi:putative DNA methylase